MRRIVAIVIATAFLAATTPALAGGYGHGHHGYRTGGHGSSFSYRYRGHGGHGAAVAGALIGGLLLVHLLTRPYYGSYQRPYYRPYHRPYYRPYYRSYYRPTYPPGPAYAPAPPAFGNCQPTTGTSIVNGRAAQYAGTMCTNPAGQGYILDGSVRFLGYLQ